MGGGAGSLCTSAMEGERKLAVKTVVREIAEVA
jgi:hypothetical protein